MNQPENGFCCCFQYSRSKLGLLLEDDVIIRNFDDAFCSIQDPQGIKMSDLNCFLCIYILHASQRARRLSLLRLPVPYLSGLILVAQVPILIFLIRFIFTIFVFSYNFFINFHETSDIPLIKSPVPYSWFAQASEITLLI